jgi:ParB-like chromosome segregation protein Spo0J
MVIIVGHTRWLAAQKIGMKTVPVHVAEGLSDEEARAYRLDDNKLHEHAQWNPAVLLEELARLSEFSEEELGFTDEEIEKLHQHLDADDGKEIPTVCEIVIECKTGDQLQELEQEFRGRGMACRPLIM